MSITCIIPSYNDPTRLMIALESALSQPEVDVEVLIVDDGSTLSTREALTSLAESNPRISLFTMPANYGQATARNIGATLARTELIAFVDQDDRIAPGWYKTAADILARQPELAGISGLVQFSDIPDRLNIFAEDIRLRGLSYVFTNNIVFRRSVFMATGGFPVGDIWRTEIAGEDGHFRWGFGQHWTCGQVDTPALIHTVKEGGSTIRFLERTHVEDGRVIHPPLPEGIGEQYIIAADDYQAYLRSNKEEIGNALRPSQSESENSIEQSNEQASQTNDDTPSDTINSGLKIYNDFLSAQRYCAKHDTYFPAYEHLLKQYVGLPITFVEIGVYNGGSLGMWRSYFGSQARIIGVDLNPGAKVLEQDGFEIIIGDQADPLFWQSLFIEIGEVDVILDDGGHMNHQQIVTCLESIPNIRDGGQLIIEDTHTSYLPEFNTSLQHTFIEFIKRSIDAINSRFPDIPEIHPVIRNHVWSIECFESIVALRIDRRRCHVSRWIDNGGVQNTNVDYRNAGLAANAIPDLSAFFE